ncbi:U6 snRNA-associated Sm-like protein LSm2 [Linnemannia zychae]|nr:U6 snRNA-associated Sm-like protein LSm2 [Linnemannia zychae]
MNQENDVARIRRHIHHQAAVFFRRAFRYRNNTYLTLFNGRSKDQRLPDHQKSSTPVKIKSIPGHLFYSFFKTLVGQPVTVELKNDLAITGVLVSVDQFLNIKLDNIKVVDEERYPHMLAVKNCFIRGSVVRYVQLPASSVDTALLQDAARRERQQPAAGPRK